MRATLVLVMGLSACGFSGSSGEGTTDGPPGDGSGDGPTGCKLFVDLCGEVSGDQPLLISSSIKINTDTDVRCRVKAQPGGPAICALFFTRVEIQSGATLTFYGSRAVALTAKDEIVIDGTLDLSSRRNFQSLEPAAGSLAGCTFERIAEDDLGGAGGGAGGTFATKGGDGGDGDADDNGSGPDDDTALGGRPGSPVPFGTFRGGCPGQVGAFNAAAGRGRPGRGGGAVYLSAPLIRISGAIHAAGAGGSGGGADTSGAGGGGGGSGGLIVIESPMVDANSSTLLATGGGGGQGGDFNSYGEDGQDATSFATQAFGGNASNNGGDGGNGALSGDGSSGSANNAGGGGGGGGVGYIRIISKSASLTGTLSAPEAEVLSR